MSDPEKEKQNLLFVDIKHKLQLQGQSPLLIDEWKIAPKLWDVIRLEVYHRGGFGHFHLTGSAVPPKTEQIYHAAHRSFRLHKWGFRMVVSGTRPYAHVHITRPDHAYVVPLSCL